MIHARVVDQRGRRLIVGLVLMVVLVVPLLLVLLDEFGCGPGCRLLLVWMVAGAARRLVQLGELMMLEEVWLVADVLRLLVDEGGNGGCSCGGGRGRRLVHLLASAAAAAAVLLHTCPRIACITVSLLLLLAV